MKTYSGELTNDTPCREHEFSNMFYYRPAYINVKQVFIDNEWWRYEPKPKKVWGIPEIGQNYYIIRQDFDGEYIVDTCILTIGVHVMPVYRCQHTAEQHAKALNMVNEFRALSDVASDGTGQWYISGYLEDVLRGTTNDEKLGYGIFGVVFNTREQAEQALAKFPKIHIAYKILQFGFHGIVEEVFG
jgi:hypothetical protein